MQVNRIKTVKEISRFMLSEVLLICIMVPKIMQDKKQLEPVAGASLAHLPHDLQLLSTGSFIRSSHE
jgi:hypothetical protein